jgi:hypothetical protein
MGKSAKHASRSGTKRKTRLKGGHLIDPVTQGTIVNLRFVVVFMSLISFFVLGFSDLGLHRGTAGNPARYNAESCGFFLQEVTKETKKIGGERFRFYRRNKGENGGVFKASKFELRFS